MKSIKTLHELLLYVTKRIISKNNIVLGVSGLEKGAGTQMLKGLFSNKGAVVGAAALAAVSATALDAEPAQAQGANVHQANVTQIEVPMRDSRNKDRRGVTLSAAVASKNAQTLILFGATKHTFAEVHEAAVNLLQKPHDNALNGVIIADGQPEIYFYVDGQVSGKVVDPQGASDLSDLIEGHVKEDFRDILLPRRQQNVALADSPAISQPN